MKIVPCTLIALMLASATIAWADDPDPDPCFDLARTKLADQDVAGYERTIYLDRDGNGRPLTTGTCTTAKRLYVLALKKPGKAEAKRQATRLATLLPDLRPPTGPLTPQPWLDQDGCTLWTVETAGTCQATTTAATATTTTTTTTTTALTPDQVLTAYTATSLDTLTTAGGGARDVNQDSAATIAAEAVQILGQIVVDRATQAAYALVARKARTWLRCDQADTRFAETCRAITDLRLQDLAMAPSVLRAALAADAITFVRAELPSKKLSTRLDGAITGVVMAALRRPDAIATARTADALIRGLVKEGLDSIKQTTYCSLTGRERVLGLAASAFASCELDNQTKGCPILERVQRFDRTCTATSPLSTDQLAQAALIAGHLQDAVSLEGADGKADAGGRLGAAVDASVAVACMYAGSEAGPYTCEIDRTAQAGTALTEPEQIAIVRDVVHAAIDRDGQGLVAIIVRALVRVLPTDPGERKGLRVLATIAAYAATYIDRDGDGKDDRGDAATAHAERTKLLESLTRDMTVRTDRGGDTIVSIGGSLRAVGGWRIGDKRASGSRPGAFYGPVSLPLGFALDHLGTDSRFGVHAELGVLDLGQYVSWDNGGQVATPDLTAAFGPSLTVGVAFGREVPLFLAGTASYSPGFDFGATAGAPHPGSYNLGVVLGAYVPLFDLN